MASIATSSRSRSQVRPANASVDCAVATSAGELASALKADPRFERCATHKLYTYALGRVPKAYDATRLADLTSGFARGGHRTRDLIIDIVHSDAFRMRRGGE